MKIQVTESSTALKEATTEMVETKRRYQTLDIDLQSALSLVRTFALVSVLVLTNEKQYVICLAFKWLVAMKIPVQGNAKRES